MVERSTVNRMGAGSSPASSATFDKSLFYQGQWRPVGPSGTVWLEEPQQIFLVNLRDLDKCWDLFFNATPTQD